MRLNPVNVIGLSFFLLKKISKQDLFFDVFKGYRKRSVAWNGSRREIDTSLK